MCKRITQPDSGGTLNNLLVGRSSYSLFKTCSESEEMLLASLSVLLLWVARVCHRTANNLTLQLHGGNAYMLYA